MTSRSLAHARRLLRLINFDVLTIEPQIHAVANIGESLRGRRQSKRRAGRPLLHIDRGAVRQEVDIRSEEHTSELQSLMRIAYAVFCLKKKTAQKYLY